MNREVGLALIPYPILTPSLISHTVSVDIRSHRAQDLCEQGGGPGSRSLSHSYSVPNKPYGFCGRKESQR